MRKKSVPHRLSPRASIQNLPHELVGNILKHLGNRNAASLAQTSKGLKMATQGNLNNRAHANAVETVGWQFVVSRSILAIFRHHVFDAPLNATVGGFKHDTVLHAKARKSIGSSTYTIELLKYNSGPLEVPIHVIRVSLRNTTNNVLRITLFHNHIMVYVKSSLPNPTKHAIRKTMSEYSDTVIVEQPAV